MLSRSSRTSSTPLLEAPSISKTSVEVPLVISMQSGQTLQGSWTTPSSQLRVLARMRAVLVLPTPRAPVNRKACATRPESMAFCRVRLTCSCPVSSENDWGRYFLARTSYDVPLDKELNLAGHLCPRMGSVGGKEETWIKGVMNLLLPSLQAQMIAGFTRGTRRGPLPLLPSGSGGVHGLPLREARLSSAPASKKTGAKHKCVNEIISKSPRINF